MKYLSKLAATAGLAVASVAVPAAITPAAAQGVGGIAVVNYQAVAAASTAFQTAQQQRQTTYATQISQANTRRTQIEQQLQPLIQAFETARRAASPDQAALQQQVAQIQQIQQAGEAELQQLIQPVQLSQAYVEEQINEKLPAAIEAAAKKNNVKLVLTPDTVLYADNAYNLNQAVVAELNAALPSVSVTPPAGWLPAEMRQQAAAQQAQQPAAAAPAAVGR